MNSKRKLIFFAIIGLIFVLGIGVGIRYLYIYLDNGIKFTDTIHLEKSPYADNLVFAAEKSQGLIDIIFYDKNKNLVSKKMVILSDLSPILDPINKNIALWQESNEIKILDVSSGNIKTVVKGKDGYKTKAKIGLAAKRYSYYIGQPRWSPGGKSIIFNTSKSWVSLCFTLPFGAGCPSDDVWRKTVTLNLETGSKHISYGNEIPPDRCRTSEKQLDPPPERNVYNLRSWKLIDYEKPLNSPSERNASDLRSWELIDPKKADRDFIDKIGNKTNQDLIKTCPMADGKLLIQTRVRGEKGWGAFRVMNYFYTYDLNSENLILIGKFNPINSGEEYIGQDYVLRFIDLTPDFKQLLFKKSYGPYYLFDIETKQLRLLPVPFFKIYSGYLLGD